MSKIRIYRKRIDNPDSAEALFEYGIVDWPAYLLYLDSISVARPLRRYTIKLYESVSDAMGDQASVNEQVRQLFHVRPGEWEVVG